MENTTGRSIETRANSYPATRTTLYSVWRLSRRGRKFIAAHISESKAYRDAANMEQIYGGAFIVERVSV